MHNPLPDNTENNAASSIPFPDEIKHLADMKDAIHEDIRIANQSVSVHESTYMDTKRYMAEHCGEIDPHEMFQNELLLKQLDRAGAISVQARDRLTRLLDSPYFARIDFSEEKGETNTFYIGKYAFLHHGEILIADWRSPVAGVFYDFEIGPAWYSAPACRIHGKLIRKQQFRIRSSEMEYALESSVSIRDDVMQRELSMTSDEKMKSIIATIQKEQNFIIRNETAGTLIIQGVAGSGKTSIALHRIAYLLYRFQDRLTAQNIAIISPNKVFGSFISDVLPELGEEPVQEISFTDIAEEQMAGTMRFMAECDLVEANDRQYLERVRYKSTFDFVRKLDCFVAEAADRNFEPVDYRFGGFCVPGEWIMAQYAFYRALPVKNRIRAVSDMIRAKLESENYLGEVLPSAAKIKASLVRMLKTKSLLALYKEFYRQNGKENMLRLPCGNMLEWADVYPYLYMRAAFDGLKECANIRHLVIDEMQDYTPVQFAVINKIYRCPKTILGDFGQSVNPCQGYGLEDMEAIFSDSEIAVLNKSYRSTYEIIHFAWHFQDNRSMVAVERHGETPVILHNHDKREEIETINTRIRAFLSGESATLGIILKTGRAAKEFHESLAGRFDSYLITQDACEFHAGISVMSVKMSKGLEFDEVLIPSVNAENYHMDFDRKLLYIACTRAMHKLTLTFSGTPSKFLPGI